MAITPNTLLDCPTRLPVHAVHPRHTIPTSFTGSPSGLLLTFGKILNTHTTVSLDTLCTLRLEPTTHNHTHRLTTKPHPAFAATLPPSRQASRRATVPGGFLQCLDIGLELSRI